MWCGMRKNSTDKIIIIFLCRRFHVAGAAVWKLRGCLDVLSELITNLHESILEYAVFKCIVRTV
jgi:hypothetical protein